MSATTSSRSGASPALVFIVDDNQELRTILSQLFEESGYRVLSFGKGKEALEAARKNAPELAVLDVLLPDLMGFALAEQLRLLPNPPQLMFMTGVFKGGKHAMEVRSKYGAQHYFEKPFDAKRLLDAVKQAVPPPALAAASAPPPPPEEDFELELSVDVETDEPIDPMELTGKIKVTGGGNITAELRGADLHAASSSGPAPGQKVAPIAPNASSISAAVSGLANPNLNPARSARTGKLQDNLPGLINAFFLAKETGELSVQRNKVKKVVYFEKGQPVFALSNLAADRFGQFLVRVGKIKAEQLADAAVVAKSSARRTGDVLVERGLLKDTERLYYVGQQVKAIIYSLFGWEDGQFTVSFREKALTETIKLDVHPGNLIVRGVKKLYKPERLRRLARPEDHLMPSPNPAYALQELELEKWEVQLLPKIDGTRTTAELLAMAGRPEHLVLAFLVAMLDLSILEKRPS